MFAEYTPFWAPASKKAPCPVSCLCHLECGSRLDCETVNWDGFRVYESWLCKYR